MQVGLSGTRRCNLMRKRFLMMGLLLSGKPKAGESCQRPSRDPLAGPSARAVNR